MQRYIAIDPGLMTGMSLWAWEKGSEPILEWSGEVPYDEYAATVRSWFGKFPDLIVICERFVITPETAKKSQAPYSLELIGMLKLIVVDHGQTVDDLTFQAPSDAMRMFTNPKLKTLGYWHRGGAGHALDSIRHGLLYFVKHGWPPKALLV